MARLRPRLLTYRICTSAHGHERYKCTEHQGTMSNVRIITCPMPNTSTRCNCPCLGTRSQDIHNQPTASPATTSPAPFAINAPRLNPSLHPSTIDQNQYTPKSSHSPKINIHKRLKNTPPSTNKKPNKQYPKNRHIPQLTHHENACNKFPSKA